MLHNGSYYKLYMLFEERKKLFFFLLSQKEPFLKVIHIQNKNLLDEYERTSNANDHLSY